MLTFVRRRQSLITLVITFCTLFSFFFFGLQRAFVDKPVDPIVWQVGPASLSAKELALRARFLSCEIPGLIKKPETWCAWINPGFLSQWILVAGVAQQMLEEEPLFRKEIESQKEKEKLWRGYRHPFLPYVTYDAILEHFKPEMAQAVRRWQADSGNDLAQKIALYRQAYSMPVELYTNVVRYQEASLPVQNRDPRLPEQSMALFGYDSLQDWFGPSFVESCVKIISLGAERAKKVGYRIEEGQVRHSLELRFEQTWRELREKGLDIDLPAFKSRTMAAIGMKAESLLSFWKDLLLFESFYHQSGSQAIAEPSAIGQLASFVAETREVELYEIAEKYRTDSLEALAECTLYWNLTSGLGWDDLELPLETKEVKEVALSTPELISKRVDLSWRKRSLEELLSSLAPRKRIEMEAEEKIWKEIAHHITDKEIDSIEERLALLSQLESAGREKVDYDMLRWVLDHEPDRFLPLLQAAPLESKTLSFALASAQQPLEGIVDSKGLFEEIENRRPETPYTQDRLHYYLFEAAGTPSEELLSFEKAKELSLLAPLLSKKIELHYEELKEREAPWLYKEGELLSVEDLRSDLLLDLLHPLLEAIELSCPSSKEPFSIGQEGNRLTLAEANAIAPKRYLAFLEQISQEQTPQKGSAEEATDVPFKKELTKTELSTNPPPWMLAKSLKKFRRSDLFQKPLAQIFALFLGESTKPLDEPPLFYQKAKLIEIGTDKEESKRALWFFADQAQNRLEQEISELSLEKWTKEVKKDWSPKQTIVESSPLVPGEKIPGEKIPGEKIPGEKIPGEKIPGEKIPGEKIPGEKIPEAVSSSPLLEE